MAIEIKQPAVEEKTGTLYCSELVVKGYQSVTYKHTNTLDFTTRSITRTPEQTVSDGAYTEEQRVQLAALLQIGCDFYATFVDDVDFTKGVDPYPVFPDASDEEVE